MGEVNRRNRATLHPVLHGVIKDNCSELKSLVIKFFYFCSCETCEENGLVVLPVLLQCVNRIEYIYKDYPQAGHSSNNCHCGDAIGC